MSPISFFHLPKFFLSSSALVALILGCLACFTTVFFVRHDQVFRASSIVSGVDGSLLSLAVPLVFLVGIFYALWKRVSVRVIWEGVFFFGALFGVWLALVSWLGFFFAWLTCAALILALCLWPIILLQDALLTVGASACAVWFALKLPPLATLVLCLGFFLHDVLSRNRWLREWPHRLWQRCSTLILVPVTWKNGVKVLQASEVSSCVEIPTSRLLIPCIWLANISFLSVRGAWIVASCLLVGLSVSVLYTPNREQRMGAWWGFSVGVFASAFLLMLAVVLRLPV